MPNITHQLIEDTPRPLRSQQLILRDDRLVGFAVRLTPTSISYIVEKRVNGRVCRRTLGKYGELTPEAAREQAQKLLAEMAAGKDPRPDRGPLLAEVLEHYLEHKRLRSRTVVSYRQVMKLHLPDFLKLPVTAITSEMVLARHKELGEKLRPTTANLVMTVLRALLYHAAENWQTSAGLPVIAANPVSKLSRTRAWYRAHRRQGVIPQHKLSDWYAAMVSICSRNIQQYLMILTLTGLRRNELATLLWTDVDFEARTLTIRAEIAKNHREHSLPLSEFLFLLLKQRKLEASSEFVFPGRHEGHMVSYLRQIRHIGEKCGCRFSLHDLRRGFVSMAATLHVQHHITKRLLNHTGDKDEHAEYIIISVEQLREPMEQITNRFLELTGCDVADWVAGADLKPKYRKATVTLEEVLEKYLQDHTLKQTSARSYRNVLQQRVPDWLPLPITSISESMIQIRYHEIATADGRWKASQAQANLTMMLLKSLMTFAADVYKVDGKPLPVVSPVRLLIANKAWKRMSPRRSVVEDQDLTPLFQAMMKATARTPADMMLLVLFTGLRLQSARTLQWGDVDLAGRTLTVRAENCVNRRAHNVPLSNFVHDLLANRQDQSDSQFVFPGRAGTFCKQFSEVQEQIRQASGVLFTPDMLRRTFLDLAERLALPNYALKAFAGEARGQGPTTLALMADMNRLRAPMQVITDYLLELMAINQRDEQRTG